MLGEVCSLDHGDNKQPDATKIWWGIRPQPQFGTLEIRIADICIDIEDTIAITALIQAIVATLLDLRSNNQSWRTYRQASHNGKQVACSTVWNSRQVN
jgi:gamma-glutamyl:cysteine ligase YbdK (ATP-grasp superfamily)